MNTNTHGRTMERYGAGERWVTRHCALCSVPVDRGYARFAVHCGAPRCAAYLDALEGGATDAAARQIALTETTV